MHAHSDSSDLTVLNDSISVQTLRDFEELISAPEIWLPDAEESQQSEHHFKFRKPLQHFFRDLSMEANKAFKEWIEDKDIELLTKQERKQLRKLKAAVEEQNREWTDFEYNRSRRIISEAFSSEVFSVQKHLTKLPPGFRGLFPSPQSLFITTVDHISVANDKRTAYYIPLKDIRHNQKMSNYQTTIWRSEHRPEGSDNFLPPTGMQDDPDFISPINIESRPLHVIKPAARPYNATFRVRVYDSDRYNAKLVDTKVFHTAGNDLKRDYNSVATFSYYIKKAYKLEHFVVDILHCSWEYDLRVSSGDTPNPREYKKVPENSIIGQKFLRKLNDNPYHEFEEFSWSYEEEGKTRTVVAYGIVTDNPVACYWVYLDEDQVRSYFDVEPVVDDNNHGVLDENGSPKTRLVLRTRTLLPQFSWKRIVCPNEHGFREEYIVGATIRIRPGTHAKILSRIQDKLNANGFVYVGSTPEVYTGYTVRKYVHRNFAKTKCIYSFDKSKFTRVILVSCHKDKKGRSYFNHETKVSYFPN